MSAGIVINAAGLYADRIASDFGFSQDYRILPFKGLYLYSSEPPGAFRTNIYPVPDLRNPFLGVHVTVTVDGKAKLGPTAIPCFWREHYDGLENFRADEFARDRGHGAGAVPEGGLRLSRPGGAGAAQVQPHDAGVAGRASLPRASSRGNFRHWGRPGIRAQLLNIKTRTLVMDFLVEGDERSLHVLNAVSPAFTCSIPFAAHVCDLVHCLRPEPRPYFASRQLCPTPESTRSGTRRVMALSITSRIARACSSATSSGNSKISSSWICRSSFTGRRSSSMRR